MTRARDVSRLVTTPPNIYATDTETSSAGYLTNTSASSTYVTQNNSNFAGKNKVINGDFSIWQRGTSFTADGYTSDRWYMSEGGSTCTVSRQTFTVGQTDVPNNPTYFLRYNVSSYVGEFNILHRIEDVSTFSGQTATLSFYMKANTSVTLNPLMVQNFGSGGSSSVNTTLDNINVTTSWQRFSITISVPSISEKTVGTSSYLQIMPIRKTSSFTGDIDIAQVQFEIGSSATTFVRAGGGSQQAELAECQRYYEAFTTNGLTMAKDDSNLILASVQYRVTKRVSPTMSFDGTVNLPYIGLRSVVSVATTTDSAGIQVNHSGSLGQAFNISGSSIRADAEL